MRRAPVLLLLLSGLIIILIMGGRLLDLARINQVSLQTLFTNAVSPVSAQEAQTEVGACRLAHVTGRYFLVRQQYEQALPHLEQGVACDTGQPAEQWAWFDLAQAQLALGDRPSAATSFANADAYNHLVTLARKAVAFGDRQGQISAWELAIMSEPQNHQAYIELAWLYFEVEPARTESILQEAIANNPAGQGAYLSLANFYSRTGQAEAAGDTLGQALSQVPASTALFKALAENATRQGHVSQAVEYWQKFAELAISEDQIAAAYFAIGNLTTADNNIASALAFYRLAVVNDSAKPGYLLALAQSYQANGCPDQAGQLFQRLLAMAPEPEIVAAAETGLVASLGQPTEAGADCPPIP